MHHRQNHPLSTFRRQASILVGVHSVLRESLVFGDFSVPGSDRMDNLLTVHSYHGRGAELMARCTFRA